MENEAPRLNPRAAPCPRPGCGGTGCDIVGCDQRQAVRWAAYARLPAVVLDAMAEGAVVATAELEDIADRPFGVIAAVVLAGFTSHLPHGWRLVGPQGQELTADDLCLGAQAYRAMTEKEAAEARENGW